LNIIRGGAGLEVGRRFNDNLRREVGDGAHTLFWWDPLFDGSILKSRFTRLFYLADNKMVTLAEMYSFGWVRTVKLGSGGGSY